MNKHIRILGHQWEGHQRIRISGKLLFLIASFFITITFSLAQTPDSSLQQTADSLYAEAKVLADSFQYDEAITNYKNAAAIKLELNRPKELSDIIKNMFELYVKLNQSNKALTYSDSLRAITRATENKEIEGYIIANVGGMFFKLEEYDRALFYYDSALTIARETKNKDGEWQILVLIAEIYLYVPEFHKALNCYDSALAIARELNNKQEEVTSLRLIGCACMDLCQYEKALIYCDSALRIAREIGDRQLERNMLIVIANAYSRLCQYSKEIAYRDSSLFLTRQMKDKKSEGNILINLGAAFHSLDQYEKALSYYDSASIIARETKNLIQQGHILRYIGQIYYVIGANERALIYCDSALAVYEKTDARGSRGVLLSIIGGIYDDLGKHEQALACCDSGLAIARETQDSRAEAIALNNIGCVYLESGRHENAIAYFDSALVKRREVKHRHGEGYVLWAMGEAYYSLGQYEKALAYYDSALIVLEEIGNRRGKGNILYAIGQVYEKKKNYEDAISYYEQSIKVKESIREELRQEQLKATYTEAQKDVYEQLINLLIMLKQYEKAFDYLERSRSEKLRKIFEMEGMTAYDPSLSRQLENINFIQGMLSDAEKVFEEKKITQKEYKAKKNELSGLLNQHLLDLKTFHLQLYNITMPQVKDLKDIQKNIPPNTVFLEFTSVENRYLVFVLTKDRFLVRLYEDTKTNIDSFVDQALTDLKWLKDKEIVDKQFAFLYDFLIKPVEPDIERFSDIVIIPYRLLHYVPFHALRRQNDKGEAEYFVQWKKISYLPSALFITDLLTSKTHAKKDLLAFANCDGSLPSAEIEVDSILKVYPKASVFKTDSATKARLIEDCCNYRLLHLATHGVLSSDPRFSHIVLSPPEQGNLTVREIVGLSGKFQNTDLVTLSACETAIEEDPQKAGMELTTLSNAFKVAGVPSIVATLWEIGDRSTAMLMKDFYGNLKKKMNKLEALRQAQLTMINNPEYSHPYYWAPFMLIGEWR